MDGELEFLGERIAEQAAHFDAAMHRLLTDVREFDQRGGWHRQGATSCAHWLAWRVGWDLVTARERVRVANRLGQFPTIDDALRRGEMSYSKVRAMMRVATPENETLLLEYARLMTGSDLEKLCRKYALVQRHGRDDRPQDDEQRRYVRRRDTYDGMVRIEAVLHPEEAEVVWAMLDHAAKQLAREPQQPASASAESRTAALRETTGASPMTSVGSGNAAESKSAGSMSNPPASTNTAPPDDSAESSPVALRDPGTGTAVPEGAARSASNPASTASPDDSAESTTATWPPGATSVLHRYAHATRRAFDRADALMAVAQDYLRGDRPDRAPIDITLTMPVESLRAEVTDPLEAVEVGDSYISRDAARRLACDAGVVEIVEDAQGQTLSVGRKRRTIAGALKRALRKRDKHCTFPGCTNHLFLKGHHVQHWADGGETSLSNGLLLCSFHHRFVHEYGYSVELGPDQRPQFRNRHGILVPAVPVRPANPDLSWSRFCARNGSLGFAPMACSRLRLACGPAGCAADPGEPRGARRVQRAGRVTAAGTCTCRTAVCSGW